MLAMHPSGSGQRLGERLLTDTLSRIERKLLLHKSRKYSGQDWNLQAEVAAYYDFHRLV